MYPIIKALLKSLQVFFIIIPLLSLLIWVVVYKYDKLNNDYECFERKAYNMVSHQTGGSETTICGYDHIFDIPVSLLLGQSKFNKVNF